MGFGGNKLESCWSGAKRSDGLASSLVPPVVVMAAECLQDIERWNPEADVFVLTSHDLKVI